MEAKYSAHTSLSIQKSVKSTIVSSSSSSSSRKGNHSENIYEQAN